MDFEVVERLPRSNANRSSYRHFRSRRPSSLHGLARFHGESSRHLRRAETANIDRLKGALRSVVNDPEIEQITAADLLGDYPAVQYVPPDGTFHIDIVTNSATRSGLSNLETERVPFDGLTVSVVTPRGLYAMKRNTVRLKDRADAEALKSVWHRATRRRHNPDADQEIPQRRGNERCRMAAGWRSRARSGHSVRLGIGRRARPRVFRLASESFGPSLK